MGSGDSEIAATFAKLATWFPPGPEGTTKGLLLPKPASGQATRLEHRLRVTLNRGPSPGPPYSEIWSALSVKMKWEAATHVRFFTSPRRGREVKSNTIVPSSSFKLKSEGVYEASLWYEGNLTQKQIAQMSQSGQKPEVKIQLNIAVEGKDKPTSATASLLPIEVTDFKAEDYGAGIETSGSYRDVNLQPGDVVVWGRSLVSAIVKVPNGFSNTIIEPRFVQDVTPSRTRIFTTSTSQGHAKEVMQYQNQKVLDNVLDESWVDLITIRRLGQDVLIESRDQPGQGAGQEHSAILIADKFETYLQYNALGHGWSTYGKVEWRFDANLSRSVSTWSGSAAITGGTGRLIAGRPLGSDLDF